jgi:hypothetical protein
MQSIRLFQKENYYSYFVDDINQEVSIPMIILGYFFSSDVRINASYFFRDWAQAAMDGDCCSGNITRLEIEGDDIVMTDLYPDIPAALRISREQFIKLFDEWLDKVSKTKPAEVIIFNDNDRFWIETKE